MKRQYHSWHSPALGREMELLVFGHGGMRVVVFPTRSGRFHDFEDWRLVDAVREHIDRGWMQLFCIDSIDGESLYNIHAPAPERIARHEQYERYILDEVIPLSLHTSPGTPAMALGCSLGAYHAMNFGLRNPGHFSRILSIGGRFTVAESVHGFDDLFGGYYDDRIAAHMPAHYLPLMQEGDQLRRLRWLDVRMVVGLEDPFVESNRHLHRELQIKGIPSQLVEWEGHGHSGFYWRRMLPLYV